MKKAGFSGSRTGMAIVLAGFAGLFLSGCATAPPVTGPSSSPSAPAAVMPKVESPVSAAASVNTRLHQGHALTMASAPTAFASLSRSAPVHWANSG